MQRALLREVAGTFDSAIVGHGGRSPDPIRARRQHDTYRRHIAEAGYEVEVLPGDDRYPDSVFVEDTAVVIDGLAVVTRPGAEERRGEIEEVALALGRYLPLTRVEAPGTVDGGDVMLLGGTLWVGLSARTSSSGAGQLGDIAATRGVRTVPVPVSQVLHLKSAVLPIDGETVVVTPGTVDETLLGGLRIVSEDEGERYRFSALPLANGRVLVTDSAPETARAVASLGFDVQPIDVSEMQAADGGLTCMSILYDDEAS
ncbi:MAG: dimethylargininase [Acidimicrobiia bacterium]